MAFLTVTSTTKLRQRVPSPASTRGCVAPGDRHEPPCRSKRVTNSRQSPDSQGRRNARRALQSADVAREAAEPRPIRPRILRRDRRGAPLGRSAELRDHRASGGGGAREPRPRAGRVANIRLRLSGEPNHGTLGAGGRSEARRPLRPGHRARRSARARGPRVGDRAARVPRRARAERRAASDHGRVAVGARREPGPPCGRAASCERAGGRARARRGGLRRGTYK